MTATNSLKAKNNAQFIVNALLFSIIGNARLVYNVVRQTVFVLPLEHPSGTKYINFPQLQCFLDKSDKSPIPVFLCFRFLDLQEVLQP